MPISFEGQQFEFQELVTHLKTNRKGIENPEKFVGSLEKEQGVALEDRFFEDDEGKWGLFFLILPSTNVNKWKVTKPSIPKRIKTFEGRPFISEPNLEHFGAENMQVLEIIRKQDEFRVGIMKKVKYDPKTEEGEVAVLFDKTPFAERVWQDMKDGNAFFVSPAIAGEFEEVNGVRIYKDWIGLHLARVANPAYGTFHASIKATCEGDERMCIQNLIATASVALNSNDTFNFTGFSCAKNMSTEEPKFEDTDAGKALIGLAADIDKLKKDVETSFEDLQNKTADPPEKGQMEIQKSKLTPGETQETAATDEPTPKETAQETPKEKELAQKLDDLEKRTETAEEDLKSRLTEDILETESAEDEIMGEDIKTAQQEEERKTELAKMDAPELKTTLAAATASLTKVSALAAKFGGKPSVATKFNKVRSIYSPGVSTASAKGYKNSNEIKSRFS